MSAIFSAVEPGASADEWLSAAAPLIVPAIPGIDLLALSDEARQVLRPAFYSERYAGPREDRLTLGASGNARPPAAVPTGASADDPAQADFRAGLGLRVLTAFHPKQSGKLPRLLLVVGCVANRAFSRAEGAFLETLASWLATAGAPVVAATTAEQIKDEFINTVSHELRTPTTTIRGGALMLLRRGATLPDDVREQLVRDIADESERLAHLVDDLLVLSRSRARMVLTPEPVRLQRVVSKVVNALAGRLGNHTVQVRLPPDLPMVETDPLALEQVLRNLIDNAARHSPGGSSIEVDGANTNSELVVSIRDHGPGIPEEDRERVFEPFARLDRSVRAATQGAGLGLAVCRRLIEMAGGRIWMEPAPGGGTIFRFTLALAAAVDE